MCLACLPLCDPGAVCDRPDVVPASHFFCVFVCVWLWPSACWCSQRLFTARGILIDPFNTRGEAPPSSQHLHGRRG